MQTELTRSRFAQETLEQSTAALADLSDQYTSLDTLLANSKNLIGTLVRSQKSDTWYLENAVYILLATIVWLLIRRIFWGPLWFFVWLPIKLTLKPVLWTLSSVGVLGNAASTASAQVTTNTRPPLIIQPSATGSIPRRPVDLHNHPERRFFPAGSGGQGAKVAAWDPRKKQEDPSPPDSLSQSVGQMAEQSQQQQPIKGHEKVVRGDGTVLEESDKPRNPKKRMWDEEEEAAKREVEKAKEEQEGKGKEKDEL